ncbi:MAG: chemotaxis protein CheW [Verrucomicrobiota bacterium]
MLAVIFHLGNQVFAIDAETVEIVIPALPLSTVPGAPEYIAGRFEYRNQVVPVVDLGRLVLKRSLNEGLSSRYILVHNPSSQGDETLMGLWAERVTETMEVDEESFSDGGVHPPEAHYLGRIFTTEDKEIIQCVETSDLLPENVRTMLYNQDKTSSQ